MNEDKEMDWLFCYNCYKKTGEKFQMLYEREEEVTCSEEPDVKWYIRVFRCPRCGATEGFPHREGEECDNGSVFGVDDVKIVDEDGNERPMTDEEAEKFTEFMENSEEIIVEAEGIIDSEGIQKYEE